MVYDIMCITDIKCEANTILIYYYVKLIQKMYTWVHRHLYKCTKDGTSM